METLTRTGRVTAHERRGASAPAGDRKIRVEQGKGRKDRNAMLSPQLLELLRR